MSTEPTNDIGNTPPTPPPEEIRAHDGGRHALVICRYSRDMCMADIEQLEERADKAAFELRAIGVPAVGLVLAEGAAVELGSAPRALDALGLLSALHRLIPGPIPAITLDEATGTKLVVTLCNREPHTFDTYTLDEADLSRTAENIAEEIANMRAARIEAVIQNEIALGNLPPA